MAQSAKALISTTNQPHPQLETLVQLLTAAVTKTATSQDILPMHCINFGLTLRLYLEACGYIDYHTKFLPNLTSSDHPVVDQNIVGLWARDNEACTNYSRWGFRFGSFSLTSICLNLRAGSSSLSSHRHTISAPKVPKNSEMTVMLGSMSPYLKGMRLIQASF